MVSSSTKPRPQTLSFVIEKPKSEWVSDDSRATCARCSTPFTLLTRRHHCRSCGDIYCSACSSRTAFTKATRDRESRAVRVCETCFDTLRTPVTTTVPKAVPAAVATAIVTSTPTTTTSTPSSTPAAAAAAATASSRTFSLRTLTLLSLLFLFIALILFFPSHCYSSLYLLSIPSHYSVDVCSTHSLPLTTTFLAFALFHIIMMGKIMRSRKNAKTLTTTTTTTTVTNANTTATTSTTTTEKKYSPRDQHYLNLVNYLLDELSTLASRDDGWAVHATRDDVVISTRHVGPSKNGLKARKIFRGVSIIPGCHPESLLNLLMQLTPDISWNRAIDGYHRLYRINQDVDITHCIAAPAVGGAVAGRDFVDVRGVRRVENGFVTGGIGINDFPVPPVKNVVRGINGIAGYGIYAVSNNPNACRLVWVMDSKLNGWLPQSMIDLSLSTVMIDTLINIREVVAARPALQYKPK